MAKTADSEASPADRLSCYAQDAIATVRKAKKHHQNLSGSSFYAKKLAELRISATNAFGELRAGSAGDTSALAELIGAVFAPATAWRKRVEAERELTFALRTTWADGARSAPAASRDAIIPSDLLQQTRRGYLIIIGRQINGCFQHEFFDACAVMMRRLFEISIIEAFEGRGLEGKIKDAAGNYLQLTDLISRTLAEQSFRLSRNTSRALPRLRDYGHLSAHGRAFSARKADIEGIQTDYRVAVEELLRIAGLL